MGCSGDGWGGAGGRGWTDGWMGGLRAQQHLIFCSVVEQAKGCPDIICQRDAQASCAHEAHTFCEAPTLSCDQGECEQTAFLGQACNSSVPCAQGICKGDSTCELEGLPGDECADDSDCVFGARACDPESQQCLGVSVNGTCSGTRDCEPGFYCAHNSVCTRAKDVGERCTANSDFDTCTRGYACNVNVPVPTCTRIFSLPSGDVGTDELCKSGYLSPHTMRCSSPPVDKRLGLPCTTDAECLTSVVGVVGHCSCTMGDHNNTAVCVSALGLHVASAPGAADVLGCHETSPCWGMSSMDVLEIGLLSTCLVATCPDELSRYWCGVKASEHLYISSMESCYDVDALDAMFAVFCHDPIAPTVRPPPTPTSTR